MATMLHKELERLSQAVFLKWISGEFQATDFLPAYWHTRYAENAGGYIAVYCALVPNAKVQDVLLKPTWDMHIGEGFPGAAKYWKSHREVVEYLRYGNNEGFEPLLIRRNYYGIRDPYAEISEEFRLFHNLYHDRKTDKYLKIDDAGNETEVAIVELERVLIRLKEIKQFLAVKEMHLAVYFDNRAYSQLSLDELGLNEGGDDTHDGLMTYGLHYGASRGILKWNTFSRLLGKRLFPPFPKEKSGFWGFAKDEARQYVDFIISVNELGEEVLSTSNEDQLGGVDPGKPNYLTPVFFRKAVLDKYYQQPEKYSVEDSIFRCGSLWDMTMDNHHDNYVVAWLGDLGRDLPYAEQLHWRSFNVAPCGNVSEVFFRRQICAQFADTDQPDLKLKYRFPSFCQKCRERLGWSVFLPLKPEDEHYFNSLRIPASNGQKEFDELVHGLAKVLVDSLNEKRMMQFIPSDQRDGVKGSISRLERALASQNAEDYEEHIQFLRDLQDLRSSGSAHRKGSKYQQVAERFATDTTQLAVVFRAMLVNSLSLIDYLEQAIEAGVFTLPRAQEDE